MCMMSIEIFVTEMFLLYRHIFTHQMHVYNIIFVVFSLAIFFDADISFLKVLPLSYLPVFSFCPKLYPTTGILHLFHTWSYGLNLSDGLVVDIYLLGTYFFSFSSEGSINIVCHIAGLA